MVSVDVKHHVYLRTAKPWCLTFTETIRLIRDGEKRGRGDYIPIAIHCHHQNDSCIKIGSDESHFNVSSVTVRDRVGHKTLSTDHVGK